MQKPNKTQKTHRVGFKKTVFLNPGMYGMV